MIIYFSNGRLGNQIFQYAFIHKIRKEKEISIVFGFQDLKETFITKNIFSISLGNRLVRFAIMRMLLPILNYISRIKLISSISVDYDLVPNFENELIKRESNKFSKTIGLLKSIVFIHPNYFQSEKFVPDFIDSKLTIKQNFLKAAQMFVADISKSYHKVFVHIRLGDYHNYTLFGKTLVLPISYYIEQINYFQQKYNNCFFIFLSDNPAEVEKNFKNYSNKKISFNHSVAVDLSIMSMCKSAIISPSSLSWWGAYFIRSNGGEILAPKYWLGFASKIETHVGSFPSFAKEVDVNI